MMRVLRTSFFPPMGHEPPMSVVIRETDLKDPNDIETLVEDAKEPGAFAVTEIMEMEDGLDFPEVTIRAMQEADLEVEGHMAVLYYYDAQALKSVNKGGMLFATKPAPLSVEQIKPVLEQLAEHPDYDHQRVMVWAEDHRIVEMQDGKIKVSSPGPLAN